MTKEAIIAMTDIVEIITMVTGTFFVKNFLVVLKFGYSI
jgi:hypothetical protein